MAATAIDLQPYASLNDEDCEKSVIRAREALGDRVVILGHHYQRDEIFKHADFSGDSLKLSRHAADSRVEYIVFCGVRFMAEVADIISRPEASFEVCQMSDYVGSTEYIIKTITDAEPGTQWLVGTELNLVEGNIVNQISVPQDVANYARVALQRMLDI
jgi:quinolinate synthase